MRCTRRHSTTAKAVHKAEVLGGPVARAVPPQWPAGRARYLACRRFAALREIPSHGEGQASSLVSLGDPTRSLHRLVVAGGFLFASARVEGLLRTAVRLTEPCPFVLVTTSGPGGLRLSGRNVSGRGSMLPAMSF